jgi:hypothetical protein
VDGGLNEASCRYSVDVGGAGFATDNGRFVYILTADPTSATRNAAVVEVKSGVFWASLANTARSDYPIAAAYIDRAGDGSCTASSAWETSFALTRATFSFKLQPSDIGDGRGQGACCWFCSGE